MRRCVSVYQHARVHRVETSTLDCIEVCKGIHEDVGQVGLYRGTYGYLRELYSLCCTLLSLL